MTSINSTSNIPRNHFVIVVVARCIISVGGWIILHLEDFKIILRQFDAFFCNLYQMTVSLSLLLCAIRRSLI